MSAACERAPVCVCVRFCRAFIYRLSKGINYIAPGLKSFGFRLACNFLRVLYIYLSLFLCLILFPPFPPAGCRRWTRRQKRRRHKFGVRHLTLSVSYSPSPSPFFHLPPVLGSPANRNQGKKRDQ